MRPELYEFAEKEILSQQEQRRIAEDLAMGPGVFGALFISGVLFLGLVMLRGSAILPTAEHPLIARANDAPLSPRAAVAMRFYFDSEPHREM